MSNTYLDDNSGSCGDNALPNSLQPLRFRWAPNGALAQEALDGKARALSRLGRTAEERAVLSTLVHRYPKSVYADRARARLAEFE